MKKSLTLLAVLIVAPVFFYVWSVNHRMVPVEYGISFNAGYAAYIGLDWKKTFSAMLTELHPKYIRIAADWNVVEKTKGVFDFTAVDWMMNEAGDAGAKVTLVFGQKTPRWPECHIPDWIVQPDKAALLTYVGTVVKRYQHHPALEFWQVENEPFIHFNFGDCGAFVAAWTHDEVAHVRGLDATHPIIVTDSGELSTWRKSATAGDYFGTTVYRLVRTTDGNIFSYWFIPPVFYRLKAAVWGRSLRTMMVSELQAEPWSQGQNPKDEPVAEQEKTMNPKQLRANMNFVTHLGVSRAYLWGVEWWYMMREKNHDARYWKEIQKSMKTRKQ